MDSMLMKKYYSYDQNVLTDQLFSVEDLKEWKRFNNYGNFRESVSSEFTNVLLNPNGNENSYFRNQLTKSMNYEELRKQTQKIRRIITETVSYTHLTLPTTPYV